MSTRPHTMCLQGGDKVAFDYALIAAGSSYPSAIKPNTAQLSDRAGRLHEFADVRSKVGAAQRVAGGQGAGPSSQGELGQRAAWVQPVAVLCPLSSSAFPPLS